MTRAQQNEIIVGKLQEQLRDTPDVQRRVTVGFRKWFRTYAVPAPTPEAAAAPVEGAPPEGAAPPEA
jgi:hypothetical protein